MPPPDRPASAPRTARERARAELTTAVLESAGRQLAEVGPAALSVRAVARDLGMASSAVYRYVPSRDALLTALLVASYRSLADAAEGAEAAVVDRADLALRFRALCLAVRAWALSHPHDYALLYGSPVPGYAAPADTVPDAIRVPVTLLRLAADAEAAGHSSHGHALPVGEEERTALAGVRELGVGPVDDELLLRGVMAWETLFGHLSLELFGHLHGGVLDYEAHFEHVVEQLALDLGLREP